MSSNARVAARDANHINVLSIKKADTIPHLAPVRAWDQAEWEASIDSLGLIPSVESLISLIADYHGDMSAPSYNYALGMLDTLTMLRALTLSEFQ